MNKGFKSRMGIFTGIGGFALAALFVTPAQAATTTGFVTITSMKATTSSTAGNIFIAMAAGSPNNEGCTNTSYIIIINTAANYTLLQTMIYDAYANGDQVNFTISGCQAVGAPTYAVVTSFIVQKGQ